MLVTAASRYILSQIRSLCVRLGVAKKKQGPPSAENPLQITLSAHPRQSQWTVGDPISSLRAAFAILRRAPAPPFSALPITRPSALTALLAQITF